MLDSLKDLTKNSAALLARDAISTKEAAESYSDSIVVSYEQANGRLTDNQREFFDSYMQTQIEHDREKIKEAKK